MKTLGIFIFDEVEVLDFAGPFEVFSVANQLSAYKLMKVHTITAGKKSVLTKNGLQVRADFNLSEIEKVDYLVIPGGDGTKKIIKNGDLLSGIAGLIAKTTWTMSVCSGSRILGKMGFLENRPYCTHHEVLEDMKEIVPSGTPKSEQRFIHSDHKIWTSSGISAGIDLALHLTEITFGEELATKTATYMEYHPYTNTK
jgi:transcriptional regulator GlxA family with amidase domain